jgi:hypothetical protein
MRYLTITYYKKASGQIDEVVAVSNRVRTRDIQSCNVILDFARMQVVKATVDGQLVPRDFDRIVGYYHQHYASTIDRLLEENGLEAKSEPAAVTPTESA